MHKYSAIIHIGSTLCQLLVGQRGKGKVNVLDNASYSLDLGMQTFVNSEIGEKSILKMCDVLNEYIKVARGYGVENIKIIGTSALREAKNLQYILEQVRIYTDGYEIEILDENEEKSLVYKYIYMNTNGEYDLNQNSLFASISTGSLGIALLKDGMITNHDMVPMGYLKMQGLLKNLEESTDRFYELLSEYTDVYLKTLFGHIRDAEIVQIFCSSQDVQIISQLYNLEKGKTVYEISKKEFETLFKEIRDLTPGQLEKMFRFLNEDQAETILYSLVIYRKILQASKVDKIVLVQLDLCQTMLELEFKKVQSKELQQWVDKSLHTFVKNVGKKYKVDESHADQMEKICLKIFDAIKRQYQLTSREKLLLLLSIQLHEVGKHINPKNYYVISRFVIRNTAFLGITGKEKEILANIPFYNRVMPEYFTAEDENDYLTEEEKLTVAKIVSIVKLGEAIDKSYKSKADKIQCRLTERQLDITVTTKKNMKLEKVVFNSYRDSFKRVFGLNAALKIKKV